MWQQRVENPESGSRFPVTVHGMLASDHDTEKASREKYQRDNKKINLYYIYIRKKSILLFSIYFAYNKSKQRCFWRFTAVKCEQ